MEKIKILLVSVGSLVGKNLLEIINHSRKSFYLTGTNSITDFDSRSNLDEFHLSPLSKSSKMGGFLESLIDEINPDLIVPCRDEEVVVLARISEKNQAIRSKISITNQALAESFLDKYKSALLCKELDLPFAKTILLNDGSLNSLKFPVIVKPREGYASQGVKIIYSKKQLDFLSSFGQEYIVQEYLSEDSFLLKSALNFENDGFPLHFSFEENKYSIQLSLAENDKDSTFFIGTHFMKNGISFEVSRNYDSSLESLARDCSQKFHQIGVRGPLNIQLQRGQEGGFKIFEFNCRFTGATSARFLLGYNELDLLLRDKLEKSPFGKPITVFNKARKVIQTIGIK
jgi:carbamoylphosphate synthase large subunit